ncbi:MAG: hypothetical protein WBC22_02930 [Sedimentisphaerales bacterium]
MNRGIDYGMGKTNIDNDNKIRFGVIHQNELLQAWSDSSEPYYPCKDCDVSEDEYDNCECDAISYIIDDGEYQAESDSCGDIFITKSPYYTHAQFCSPCAPGACYIMNSCDDGEKAYCFGHDWFEGGKAPYPVFNLNGRKQEVVK